MSYSPILRYEISTSMPFSNIEYLLKAKYANPQGRNCDYLNNIVLQSKHENKTNITVILKKSIGYMALTHVHRLSGQGGG